MGKRCWNLQELKRTCFIKASWHCNYVATRKQLCKHLIPHVNQSLLGLSKISSFICFWISKRDLILTQRHHNNCTTPLHIRVGPTHWAPPPCEEMLCSCCGGVVNLSFSYQKFVARCYTYPLFIYLFLW
jgi:hypothetical protein